MKILSISAFFLAALTIIAILGYKWSFGQSFGPISTALLLAPAALALFCLTSLSLLTSRFEKIVLGLWIAGFSFGLSYFFVDVLLGVILIRPISPPVVVDPIVHHRFEPNSVTLVKSAAEPVEALVRANNLGLRGPDIVLHKPQGHFRVILLGDSFTLGAAVAEEQTFAAILQRELNKQLSTPVEVINAGINSYSPVLSALQLEHQLLQLSPDLVVLNLDMSDLMQEQEYRSLAKRNERGQIVTVSGISRSKYVSRIRKIERWVVNNLYISRLIYYWFNRFFNSRQSGSMFRTVTVADPHLLDHTLSTDLEDRTSQWNDIFESIVRIRDLCNQVGAQFLLSTYPWGHQVGEHEWTIGRKLFLKQPVLVSDKSLREMEQRSAQNNIEFFNLFPVFREYQGAEHLYFDSDMHWTPKGHLLMAQALFPKLRSLIVSSVP